MNWYLRAIKNYVNFSGRARRKEYWMFFLFNMIFGTVAAIIDRIIGSDIAFMGVRLGYGVIGIAYSTFVLIPSLSISFRRLHDIDKSAGWLFIGLIPVVGAIWLFVYSILAGTPGDNRFGADPKADNVAVEVE